MSKFTELRDAIELFFTHNIWDFILPFIKSLESSGASILIQAAENAVTVGFAASGNNQEKMSAALASFSAELAQKGLPFIESQARTMIEMALQKAKAPKE